MEAAILQFERCDPLVTKPRALFEARQTVQFVYIKCQLGMRGYTAGANALLLAIGALYFAPSHAFLSLAPLSLRPTTCAPAISANLPLVAARSASMSPSIFMLAKKKVSSLQLPDEILRASAFNVQVSDFARGSWRAQRRQSIETMSFIITMPSVCFVR